MWHGSRKLLQVNWLLVYDSQMLFKCIKTPIFLLKDVASMLLSNSVKIKILPSPLRRAVKAKRKKELCQGKAICIYSFSKIYRILCCISNKKAYQNCKGKVLQFVQTSGNTFCKYNKSVNTDKIAEPETRPLHFCMFLEFGLFVASLFQFSFEKCLCTFT